MIGAIIGDIAGSRYERINHKSKEFKFFDRICQPTDDSVMSLAVAKAILDSAGDVDSLGKTAISAMQELGRIYKNAGYGGTFIKWLWAEEPQPYNSFGNGSAMRVGPCGFAAKNLEEAKLLSTKVTEISHNHPEGLKGAEAIATAVFLARIGKSMEEIRNYTTANYYDIDFSLDQIRKTYKFDVSCQGSVPVALEAFFEAVDFEDAIRNAISVGGDSDTIAAMAGAVAEAFFGVPERIIESAIEYLDARQMEILYYFEKRYPSKALDEEEKAIRTVFEVLDDSVDKVIPAGTTIGVDGEYSSGAVHAWVDHEALQPDFSSFDKKDFRKTTRERLESILDNAVQKIGSATTSEPTKVAVVTGGASGIGKCIAEEFRRQGAKVYVIDKAPGSHYVGDISDKSVLEAFAEKVISESGGIDYLINNALPLMKGIDECSYEEFQYALAVGVTAPFYLSRLFAPYFREGACIINISSSRDRMSQPQTESYTAAKGGIAALTHALAASFAGRVRVNSISPGWIDTDYTVYEGPDALQQPAGRVGNPMDIANMVLFLCSDKAGFITGENICIDGGMTKLMIYHDDHGWTYAPEQ